MRIFLFEKQKFVLSPDHLSVARKISSIQKYGLQVYLKKSKKSEFEYMYNLNIQIR